MIALEMSLTNYNLEKAGWYSLKDTFKLNEETI
jgi:hypothetical protein